MIVKMPERNSSQKELPTTILRRSPRFLPNNQTNPEEPKSSKPEPKGIRIPSSGPPLSSTRNLSLNKTYKHHPEELSSKVNESNKLNIGSRRSARLIGCVKEVSCVGSSSRGSMEKRAVRTSNSAKANATAQNSGNGKLEKRVTRSLYRGNINEDAEKTSNGESTEFSDKGDLSDENKTKLVMYLAQQFTGKLVKKNSQTSYEENAAKHAKNSGNVKCNESLDMGVLLNAKQYEQCVDKLGKRMIHSCEASSAIMVGGGEREGRDISKGLKHIGVKRNRNQVEECQEIDHSWTKDQELALERAYLGAKPTPHFWKKVARLVPGKSAQDCFDKVHSSHLTPPQSRPRSRAGGLKSSPPSLSASELLNSSEPKVQRPTYSKRKSHRAQKIVRHILQKQYQVNQGSEADLFSVLEPSLSPYAQAFQRHLILSTPDRNQQKPEFLKRCQERTSSTDKENRSRFSSLYGTTLLSPPVLKQVKNKALHEKYIDRLHCREVNRKAAFARVAKSHQGKGVEKEIHSPINDAIRAAKNALVFDARDAINQFQRLQANMMSSFSDDDGGPDNDEDEGEDVF